jgi:hypothetical protein
VKQEASSRFIRNEYFCIGIAERKCIKRQVLPAQERERRMIGLHHDFATEVIAVGFAQ